MDEVSVSYWTKNDTRHARPIPKDQGISYPSYSFEKASKQPHVAFVHNCVNAFGAISSASMTKSV